MRQGGGEEGEGQKYMVLGGPSLATVMLRIGKGCLTKLPRYRRVYWPGLRKVVGRDPRSSLALGTVTLTASGFMGNHLEGLRGRRGGFSPQSVQIQLRGRQWYVGKAHPKDCKRVWE